MNIKMFEKSMMQLAETTAQQSHDPKLKVGCVITTTDFKKHFSCYNGNEEKGSNDRDSMEKGKSQSVHAEINALIANDIPSNIDKYMFISSAPSRS